MGRGGVDSLLNKLYTPRPRRGLLSAFGAVEAVRQTEVVRGCAEQFFRDVLAWAARQPRPGNARGGPRPAGDAVRVRPPHPVGDPLSEELLKLATRLTGLSA